MLEILEEPLVRKSAAPITPEAYHTLHEAGLISERTELLNGVIVEKMSKSPLHSWVVNKLLRILFEKIPSEFAIRKEDPVAGETSEAEPDIAIVPASPDDYLAAHPREAVLIIEVAVRSQQIDRAKASIYAAMQIPEYWLVLPEQRKVELFREPKSGAYSEKEILSEGDTLCCRNLPEASIPVSELFPVS